MIVKIENVKNNYLELSTDQGELELKLECSEITATLISERVRIVDLIIDVFPEDMETVDGFTPDYEATVRTVMKRALAELGA
ncbi:hypothetical protein GTY77_18130 [Streptomyces sp. SID8380]|nr:hypothetical protein [Streptomyces sp. SID8380]